MNLDKQLISFVLPVYDEVLSIEELIGEINHQCSLLDLSHEIIVIDDGSRDLTWTKVQALTRVDNRIKGLRLRRNFGKSAALSAGVKFASGGIIFTIDTDLQDNPADIQKFLQKVDEGYDLVTGWRKDRHDSFFKKLQSRIFNSIISRLTGLRLHDHNCGFKCFRREVFGRVKLYGDMHRFVASLAHMHGFRVGEVQVNHRPRIHGHSKYGNGLARAPRGFFDLLTVMFLMGFRYRPMHLLGSIGLLSFIAGTAGLALLAYLWLMGHHIGHRPLMIYSLGAMLFGFQALATGMLAELFTSFTVRYEDTYSIRESASAEVLVPEVKDRSLYLSGHNLATEEPRDVLQ